MPCADAALSERRVCRQYFTAGDPVAGSGIGPAQRGHIADHSNAGCLQTSVPLVSAVHGSAGLTWMSQLVESGVPRCRKPFAFRARFAGDVSGSLWREHASQV